MSTFLLLQRTLPRRLAVAGAVSLMVAGPAAVAPIGLRIGAEPFAAVSTPGWFRPQAFAPTPALVALVRPALPADPAIAPGPSDDAARSLALQPLTERSERAALASASGWEMEPSDSLRWADNAPLSDAGIGPGDERHGTPTPGPDAHAAATPLASAAEDTLPAVADPTTAALARGDATLVNQVAPAPEPTALLSLAAVLVLLARGRRRPQPV